MLNRIFAAAALLLACLPVAAPAQAPAAGPAGAKPIRLTERRRVAVASLPGRDEPVEQTVEWAPNETALIICDMWDRHWCDGATRRCAELAPRIDAVAKALRARGALIVHAPSDTMKYYEGTPQRRLAEDAPKLTPPPLAPHACPALPIDDSDGGCDDDPPHKESIVWKRENPAIEVAPQDAVSDQGAEIYNLFRQRGIRHVILCGVHANMCILNRTFAIKQLVRWGFDAVLLRDLTDAMYNPRRAPFVAHWTGVRLVVEYIEKNWCPSALSSDILGDPRPPRVVIVTAEQEYDARQTLANFAHAELEQRLGLDVKLINSDSTTDIPGLEALDDADLLILFMRRRTLPDAELKRFQAYFDSGRPLVALRTSCHAFQNWLEFDDAVLGCHYHDHYKNGLGSDAGDAALTHVSVDAPYAGDPLLRGVPVHFDSFGSLYKVAPLNATAEPLLTGVWSDKPAEPVAWINRHAGGRVFFTSLGHPKDFDQPAFRTLLTNGILWALDRPIPTSVGDAAGGAR